MKRTQFITGYQHPSLRSISFLKVCLDPFAALPQNVPAPAPSSASSLVKKLSKLHMSSAVGLASGGLVAFLVFQIGLFLYFLKRRNSGAAWYLCQNSISLISLSYSEPKDVTSNFKQQLGLNLYQGLLPTNQVVVVKELKSDADCGENIGGTHFRSWIPLLGGIHHKNLVKLEGYCCNSGQRFLIYEFLKNSSVDK